MCTNPFAVDEKNQALPQDCKENIPRTHAQEIMVWQNDLSG